MAQETDWDYVSKELAREWGETSLGHSHPWDEVQDDVHFGWDQARSPEFDGAEWPDVESEIQRRWEQSFPHRGYEDWRMVGEAVRLGFNRARGRVY